MTQQTITELLEIRDRLRSLRGVRSNEATAERLYLAWRLRWSDLIVVAIFLAVISYLVIITFTGEP